MKIAFMCLVVFLGLLGCEKLKVEATSNPAEIPSRLKVKFMPPPPPYPEEAKAAGIEGKVVVTMVVRQDGLPIYVRAVEGPPLLRKAAEFYAMGWVFEPFLAASDGETTARYTLTMPFNLRK